MIKVGIIGCGFMGRMHGNCYAQIPEAQVVAAADLRPEILEQITGPTGATGYPTGKALLEQADVDLVDITLPTFLHAEHAVLALESGRDVLCEKPMALNSADCRRMIDAAKANGRSLMIAHCIRFWPEYLALKDFHDSARLGKLLNFTATRVGAETQTSWQNWMLDESLSGSQTLDRHIHDTDFILHLLGKPKAVISRGSETASGVSHIYTHYEYDGPVAFAEGSADEPQKFPFTMAFQATFEDGALIYSNRLTPTLMAYQTGKDPWAPELPAVAEAQAEAGGNISSLGGYLNEIRYYIDCLLAGKSPDRCPPTESMQAVEICLAEIQSARSGERVSLETKEPLPSAPKN